jgi:hypothetical protein
MRYAACALLISSLVVAPPLLTRVRADEVPKTVEGGSHKVKRGGKEVGQGFRHLGRGIKKVFKGERSKDEFRKTTKIGEGFKDMGTGTAGVGRGVGRGVKKGMEDDDEPAPAPPDDYAPED